MKDEAANMDEGMAERDQLYQRAEKLSAMLSTAAEDLTGAVADVNAGTALHQRLNFAAAVYKAAYTLCKAAGCEPVVWSSGTAQACQLSMLWLSLIDAGVFYRQAGSKEVAAHSHGR